MLKTLPSGTALLFSVRMPNTLSLYFAKYCRPILRLDDVTLDGSVDDVTLGGPVEDVTPGGSVDDVTLSGPVDDVTVFLGVFWLF